MSSKYFIWIDHVSIYLREFSWDFWNFLSIFHALKHFLGNVFALKIEFRKTFLFLWAKPIRGSPPLLLQLFPQLVSVPTHDSCAAQILKYALAP
jgi:hypothetical protein